jgi:AraC-like DNA-binding protein
MHKITNDELLGTGETPLAKGTTLFACKLGCKAKNLITALTLIEEFYNLTLGPLKLSLKRHAGKVRLYIDIKFKSEIQQVIISEIYLMVFYRLICMLINKRITIYQLFFAHAEHSYSGEYNLMSNNKPVWNCDYLGFEFNEHHLQDPVKVKFAQISAYFKNPIQLVKLHLADSQTFSGKIQYLFMSEQNIPTKGEVAKKFNISPRTLHRKLVENGTCYQQLKDEYRYKLAVHYLINTQLTLEEIAFKLKLCDTSSFIHSFKKWSGKNPNTYRQVNKK